jgi:hypothetical protein
MTDEMEQAVVAMEPEQQAVDGSGRLVLVGAGQHRVETSRPSYALTISTAEPPPDYADGCRAVPISGALWVPKGDELNVRAAPSARAPIVGWLANGKVLRNGGCRMNGSTRWCQVEMPDGGVSGWVAGRYLRE